MPSEASSPVTASGTHPHRQSVNLSTRHGGSGRSCDPGLTQSGLDCFYPAQVSHDPSHPLAILVSSRDSLSSLVVPPLKAYSSFQILEALAIIRDNSTKQTLQLRSLSSLEFLVRASWRQIIASCNPVATGFHHSQITFLQVSSSPTSHLMPPDHQSRAARAFC